MFNSTDNKESIVRGGETIDQEDLRGQLALALRLENIGVLLGAGASVYAGGRTMTDLWRDLVPDETRNWLRQNDFVSVPEGETPDIEKLLSRMQLAIREADRRGEQPGELREHSTEVKRAVVTAAILDDNLWEAGRTNEVKERLQAHSRLLARLQGSRQPGQAAPWVFTLNYDLAVEWAAEQLNIHIVNGFRGIHDRRFQPNAFDLSLQNTKATGEARFGSYNLNLAKLHGSLSWRIRDDGEAIEVPNSSVWPDLKEFRDGGNLPEDEPFLLLPTAAKYVDSVGFVYGELIRRLTEFLARPNTALIISGYGFNDEHVNRLLSSGLLNPTLQVVIYYPGWDGAEDIDNPFLDHLRSLDLPRVTIRGGGDNAKFEAMSNEIPDPAMIDELSDDVKRMLSKLARGKDIEKDQ